MSLTTWFYASPLVKVSWAWKIFFSVSVGAPTNMPCFCFWTWSPGNISAAGEEPSAVPEHWGTLELPFHVGIHLELYLYLHYDDVTSQEEFVIATTTDALLSP